MGASRRLFSIPTRSPKAALALACAATVISVCFIPSIRKDVRIEKVFPRADPSLAEYDEFKQAFGSNDAIAICGITLAEPILTDVSLERLRGWTHELKRSAFIQGDHLLSLTEIKLPKRGSGDLLEMEAVFTPANGLSAKERAERLFEHRALRERFLSENGLSTALFVPMAANDRSESARRRFVAFLDRFFADRLKPSERVHFEGFAVTEVRLYELLLNDVLKVFPIAALLCAAGLYAAFRDLRFVATTILSVLVAAVWTLGAQAALDVPMSFLSTAVPVMVIVVVANDAIFFAQSFLAERGTHDDASKALISAVEKTAGPCLVTSITTAAGFFSLGTSRLEVIRELSVPTGLAVVFGFISALVVLPPLWILFPLGPLDRGLGAPRSLLRPLNSLIRGISARPLPIAGAFSLLLVASAVSAPKISIRSRLLDDFSEHEPLMESRVFFEGHLHGFVPLEVMIDSGAGSNAVIPEVIDETRRLAAALRDQRFLDRGVLAVASIHDVLDLASDAILGRPASVSASRETLAELLFIARMQNPDPTKAYVDFDRRRLRLELRIKNLYTEELFELIAAIEREAKDLMPDRRVVVTGRVLMSQVIHRSLVRDITAGLGTAVVTVLLVLYAFLRSFRLALLSLVPNLAPLVLAVGGMALLGIDLNIATSIVFTVVFGITVDDTVHFLATLREQISMGQDLRAALGHTLREVGAAMGCASLILILGFSTLLLSSFPGNRIFGAVVMVTLVIALLCDLLFVPTLLLVFGRVKGSDSIRGGDS